VIAHKSQNRLENFNYAEYQQYERMIFSLSDLSEKFKQKGYSRIINSFLPNKILMLLVAKTVAYLYGGKAL